MLLSGITISFVVNESQQLNIKGHCRYSFACNNEYASELPSPWYLSTHTNVKLWFGYANSKKSFTRFP